MAIQLNGSSQYVQRDCTGDSYAPDGIHFTSSYTVAGWVRRDGGASSEMGVFSAHNTQTGNTHSLILEHSPSNTLIAYQDASQNSAPGHTFTTTEWVYVVMRWDGQLYGSFALAGATSLTNGTKPTAVNDGNAANWLSVGRWPSGLYFNGSVAHFRVWSSLVSDANLLIEMDYTTQAAAASAGSTAGTPYLAWEFASDATDSSGNGRNGTAYGSPSYVSGPTLSGGASAVAAIAGRHYSRMRA